jgi:ClpP class serine protease
MPRIRHIASLLNSPLFALDMRTGHAHLTSMVANSAPERFQALAVQAEGDSAAWYTQYMIESGQFPYYVNTDGSMVSALSADSNKLVKRGAVAVVPIQGVIVKECWDIEELFYGICSAARIAGTIRDMVADDRIASVVLKPYTPGGMVYGTEAIGDAVKDGAAQKPVIACVDHLAASAGYWSIANCTEIRLMGKTSEVGSIGVMNSWLDFIGYWEKLGAKHHEYYAPESTNKNEEWRAVKTGDATVLEKSMSTTAQLFQSVVLEARGAKLDNSDKAVLAGRVYEGDNAIKAGLADGYASLGECIALGRSRAGIATNNNGPNAATLSTTENPKTMDIKSKVVAILAAFNLVKEEVTDEVIAEINAEVAKKEITNLAVVSTAEQQRLATAAADVSAAKAAQASAEQAKQAAESALSAANTAKEAAESAKATAESTLATVTAERDALKAVDSAVSAAATKHELKAEEGSTVVAAVVKCLDETKAALATATARITELEGEDAPDARAGAVINKEGDTRDAAVAAELKELDAMVKVED